MTKTNIFGLFIFCLCLGGLVYSVIALDADPNAAQQMVLNVIAAVCATGLALATWLVIANDPELDDHGIPLDKTLSEIDRHTRLMGQARREYYAIHNWLVKAKTVDDIEYVRKWVERYDNFYRDWLPVYLIQPLVVDLWDQWARKSKTITETQNPAI